MAEKGGGYGGEKGARKVGENGEGVVEGRGGEEEIDE